MPTSLDASPSLQARLLIHAAADPAGSNTYIASTLQWLRGLYPAGDGLPPGPPVALHLHIDDLQGQRVFSDDAAGPLVALDLPEGTYHVTAVHGNVCRSYTLALLPGNSFDLYLCPSLKGGCR